MDGFNARVEHIRWQHRSRRWTVHIYQDLMNFCIVNANALMKKELGIGLTSEEFVFGLYHAYLDEIEEFD